MGLTTTNPTARAAELGTEHGKAAAETWVAEVFDNYNVDSTPRGQAMRTRALADIRFGLSDAPRAREDVGWPQPDLSDHDLYAYVLDTLTAHSAEVERSRTPGPLPAWRAAYDAAFTAAVEATIRARCRTA